MFNNRFARKATAWALIAALVNPAVMMPNAYGRDTDIFMGLASSVATAEPNILLLLDTSDSMNTYEGWREYEGEYDSHIEYLWNDPTYINTITTVAPNEDFSNVGSSPNGYFTSWSGTCPAPLADNTSCPRDSGFFAGGTDAVRAALKAAALAHAKATESGDPGERSTYRNYSNANWIYWLPAGTAETDSRLGSQSFNRFAGGIRTSNFSSTNGTANPVVRGGFKFGNNDNWTVGTSLYTASNTRNRCTASLDTLMPSTVYAPTQHARNSGKWLNQQWMRWERWLNLENSRAAVYPGSHSLVNLGGTNYRIGYSGSASDGYDASVTPFPGPLDPVVNPPNNNPHGVSVTPSTISRFRDNIGSQGSQGQPIRVQLDMGANGFSDNPADSHAGWTEPKADLGGYNFQGVVNGLNQSVLESLRSIYGYGLLSVTGASAVENERFSAWLGNRDNAATTFGLVTGTPAYYNTRPADIAVTSGTTTTSCTRTCGTLAPGVTGPTGDGPDGGGTNRFYYVANGSGQYCDPNGTLSANCAGAGGTIADPPLCGTSGVTNYVNRNNTGCTWSGRMSKYVEGVGTVFYGGTCSGSCRGAGFVLGASDCADGENSTSYCNQPTAGNMGVNWVGTFTVDGVAYTNVTKNVVGTCSDLGDTSQNCSTRKGGLACVYASNNVSSFCPNRTSSVTTGGSTTNYARYNRNGNDDYLVHDCKADEPGNNGGANVYMTSQKRNFDQSYNTSISNAGSAAAYSTSAANATNPPAIDLYSVNYLNWKFGPKGPNGHPIGRKTRLQIAKDALVSLVNATDGVRFGLETFNALPSDSSLNSVQGSQGGKIVFPVKRMGSNAADADYANRAALNTVINNQLAKASTPLTESMYEAYLYFSGRAPRFGTASAITANFGAAALPAVGGGNVTDGADSTAVSSGNYVSPIMNNPSNTTPSSCQKNFVILITDGGPEKDVDANDSITPRQYTSMAGTMAPDTRIDTAQTDTASGQFETGTPSLPYGPPSTFDTSRPDGGYVWLDELSYFMSKADMSPGAAHLSTDTSNDQLLGTQTVVTYTIGFAGANSPVLENAATRAGGAYYVAEDSAQLSAALIDALIQIKAYTPTVAAPTVPLSALNRAQNALDVYLAFFAPAPSQAWKGTVKRFRLGTTEAECGPNKALCLTGQTTLTSGYKDIEKLETDPLTGFEQVIVDPEAVSYWNPSTLQDGSKPDKGGTGHQLVGTTGYTPETRKVYTFLSSNPLSPPTSATLTDTTNLVQESNPRITKAMLGNAGMSDATRSTLINYIRGGNPGDASCSDAYDASGVTACTTWRTWAHADVQHSRPAIITYNSLPTTDAQVPGADRATEQYMFYLTNDGLLHAIDAATGQEKWAFLVEEALPFLNASMANANGPSLDLADGAPAFWFDRGDRNGIVDGSERVWLYFGLRRGGRAYYAIDITSITSPRFMWRLTPTERCTGTSCSATTDFALMGQTWSTPVPARVAATTGASGARPAGDADPVVMFGGGYDPQQDTYPLPAGTTSDTMGRALFVVEGSTGALVKRFSDSSGDFLNAASGIQWSIPSDLTVINTDADAQSLMDRIVVGDVGGNLWRFDIGATDAANWKGKLLAVLSDPGVPNRKILFPPAVVPQLAPFSIEWDAVYVGTGDREHPLVTPSSDKIFMVADFDIGLTATAGTAASYAAGDFLTLSATDTSGVLPNTLVTKRGWARDLEVGEKVTSSPFVIGQKLRFSSYNPEAISSECLPPGEGRLNEISALYGNIFDLNRDGTISARDRYYAGVSRGYYSPLQTVIVGGSIYTIGLAGGNVTNTTTPPASGCGAGSQLFSCREGAVGVAARIYWYMEPEQ